MKQLRWQFKLSVDRKARAIYLVVSTGEESKTMATPKLSRRFRGLEAETVQIDKDLSGYCESFSESIKQRVDELERAERQLGVIRATLLVNFGARGAAGIKAGVSVNDNVDNVATLDLMLSVLEQLCDKIEKLKPLDTESGKDMA